MPIDLERLIALTKRAAAQPMSPGNQAMASAAQMAAPPGAPPLPSAPTSPNPSEASQTAEPSVPETQYRKDLDGKTKEIESLRSQLQDAKAEAQRTKMRSELQQQQQKMQQDLQLKQQAMLDKVKTEQAALDKRQAEVEQQAAQQRIQLERDSAQQQMNIAREEAKSIQNIAKRDADSIKATAADNAKSYVRMTDDARKAADGYMASKQQAFDKQVEANRKNSPYVSPALQSQLRGAMAAAHNVGKFRARLAKTNANIHKEASQAPAVQQAPQQPAQQPAQQQPAAQPQQPVQQQAPQPQQQPAPQQQQPAPQQPAAPRSQLSAEQMQANARLRTQENMARSRQNRNQRANTILGNVADKVSLQGSMLDRHKGVLTARANMERLAAKGAQNTDEYKQWAQAYNYANSELTNYRQDVERRAAAGDAAAKEELAQMTDFTQKRETSGFAGLAKKVNPVGWLGWGARKLGFDGVANGLDEVASFGASDRKSEEEEFLEAARHGMTPEQYAESKKSNSGGFTGFLKGFFVDPFVNAGNSFNANERASQLAANRGVSRNWWSDDYSDQGAAGKNYLEAIRARGLKHSALGNAGSIALSNGLAALDAAGTAAMVVPGLGTAAGLGIRGLSAAGKGLAAYRAANAASKGSRLMAAARGTKDGWTTLNKIRHAGGRLSGAAGAVQRYNAAARKGINAFKHTSPGLYKTSLIAPFAAAGGEVAALGGQLAGTDKLNFLSQQAWGAQDMAAPEDMGRQVMEGYLMDGAGNLYDPYTGERTYRDWIRGSHAGSDDGAMARTQRLNAYKYLNPGWQDRMTKAGSIARSGQDSWNHELIPSNIPDSMYEKGWLGKGLAFASPFVSSATGGMINLVPSYEMPLGKVTYADPNEALAMTENQMYNALYNRKDTNLRLSPLVQTLQARRAQALGYGPLLN